MKTMYHGTIVRYVIDIVNNGISPTINMNNELDFGFGFYLGDLRYAKRIAQNKANLRKLREDYDEKLDAPAIIAYEVNLKGIFKVYSKHNRMLFKTNKFRHTVFNCRYHKGKDILGVPYVEAPVADGKADEVMEWYKEKETKLRKVVALLNYGLPSFHRQLVVKDITVLNFIKRKHILRKENNVWESNLEVIE